MTQTLTQVRTLDRALVAEALKQATEEVLAEILANIPDREEVQRFVAMLSHFLNDHLDEAMRETLGEDYGFSLEQWKEARKPNFRDAVKVYSELVGREFTEEELFAAEQRGKARAAQAGQAPSPVPDATGEWD